MRRIHVRQIPVLARPSPAVLAWTPKRPPPDPARPAPRRRTGPDRHASRKPVPDPRTVMGITFRNPVGLAAGLDKDGAYIDGAGRARLRLHRGRHRDAARAAGQSEPRMFRLPAARGSSTGWASTTAASTRSSRTCRPRASTRRRRARPEHRQERRHADRARRRRLPVLPRKVYPFASYVTVNISSPNTKNLRQLQGAGELDAPAGAAEGQAAAPGRPARPLRAARAEDRAGPRRRADQATSPTRCCATRSTA